MRCEDTPARLADYLTGTLSGSERRELEEHAQTCGACREELQSASDTWERLGAMRAHRADTNAMRRRFEALLDEETRPGRHDGKNPANRNPLSQVAARQATQVAFGPAADAVASGAHAEFPGKPDRAWLRRRRIHSPLVQGAAAILLLVAGFQLGRQVAPPAAAPSADVGELRREVHELRQMMALSLLHQQSASERLRGVSWSGQIAGAGNEVVAALINTLMRDENVNVRLASIDVLKRFADRDTVRTAAIRALNAQTSPLVQMALIDFVVETRERAALDVLQRLSSDNLVNESVRARARAGIEHLEAA